MIGGMVLKLLEGELYSYKESQKQSYYLKNYVIIVISKAPHIQADLPVPGSFPHGY